MDFDLGPEANALRRELRALIAEDPDRRDLDDNGLADVALRVRVSRYSQRLRRLPFGRSATLHRLTRHVGRRGLDSPYDGS